MMSSNPIRDFHAHIYFNPDELEKAQALAAAAHDRFDADDRENPDPGSDGV